MVDSPADFPHISGFIRIIGRQLSVLEAPTESVTGTRLGNVALHQSRRERDGHWGQGTTDPGPVFSCAQRRYMSTIACSDGRGGQP